ncbi:MAG: hypothetical protein HF314_16900 [Ignavibacteria bacterium]|jgi:hypothetical protein|nr:hypothetical protein [Ignavibacteria bacterium]MCU7504764.1 hypothetical protein [Ignavibacteria bacterium]MCU7518367.1 hypothetical protein [Ignavibacteria bacterium]
MTDNDAVGFSVNKFPILPSSLSYVRYWKSGNSYWNYQFHINSILPGDFNPPFETDIAVSRINNHSVHSFKLGLGFYTTPIIPYLAERYAAHKAFVPVISYSLQNPTIHLEAEAILGMSKYFVTEYKSEPYLYSDADTIKKVGSYRYMKRIYKHEEVKKIIQTGNDYHTAIWRLLLADGYTLILDNRDPYADCFECDQVKRELEAYKASEDNRVLWAYYDDYQWVERGMSPTLIEVNMKKAVEEFNKGNDLILISDKDLLERSLKNINPILDDLFFSIGHSWR